MMDGQEKGKRRNMTAEVAMGDWAGNSEGSAVRWTVLL